MAKPDQSQMNFSPTSYTNSGTAGGTGYYINLGGLKICWGTTGAIGPNNATATAWIMNFPSSFFSTIQSCVITATGGTTSANQFIAATGNSAATTSSVNFYMISTPQNTNNGTTTCSWLVIGT